MRPLVLVSGSRWLAGRRAPCHLLGMRWFPALLLLGCLPDPSAVSDDSAGTTSALTLTGTLQPVDDMLLLATEATIGLVEVLETSNAIPTTGRTLTTIDPVSVPMAGQATSFVLPLPDQPDASWLTVPEGTQDFYTATFIVGAWEDADGDDSPDPSETMVAASPTLLVWVEGEVPESYASVGFEPGWNRMLRSYLEGGGATANPVTEGWAASFSLATNLLPIRPSTLEGESPVTVADTVSILGFVGSCDGAREYGTYATGSISTSGEFSIDMPSDPPGSEWDTTDLLDDCGTSPVERYDLEGSAFEVVSYRDLSGDGVFDQATEPALTSSTSGDPASVLVYLRPIGLLAFVYTEVGGRMGWNRLAIGGVGNADFLDWEGMALN